jgi:hypothetical protein
MTRAPTLPAATKARLLGGGLLCAAAGLLACGSHPGPAPVAVATTAAPAPPRPPTVTTGRRPVELLDPGGYRFTRPPVVVFFPDKSPPGDYRVFVRTNRRMPHNARGLRVMFQLDGGTGSFGLPVTVSRRPACYESAISAGDNPRAPQNIIYPRDGQLVTVTMRFPGHDGATATVALRAVPPPTFGADHLAIKTLRGLGCHISVTAMARGGAH